MIGSRFIHSASGATKVDTGTGWLLNDSFVMTAGHMLYDSNYGYTDHCGIFIGSSDGKYKHYRLGYKGQSGSPVYSYRMGYGYCVEGMIVATSTKNEGEPRNFIILMNNFLTGFINNLP